MTEKTPNVHIKELFSQYASLKATIKAAEKQLNKLNPSIRDFLESNDMDEANAPGIGKFSFTVVPQWKFPPEIEAFEEELEKKKTEAQQKGTATYTERKDLKFYPEKKDE